MMFPPTMQAMKVSLRTDMRAYERLLKYVTVDTTSDGNSESVPTTKRQFDLARILVDELKQLGVNDARCDDMCYVYGSIPATKGFENKPAVGLIAHLDTSSDYNGCGVTPVIHENYDGNDIVIGDKVIETSKFTHLKGLVGRTIITSNGDSLLGADDKAGIAEIMTVVERLGEINHPKVCVCFTPDEEVGSGADHFDVAGFGADVAYTLDGAYEGEIVYENFNAYEAIFEIKGYNVHPGEAKDKMINAANVACEINSMLPACETPRDTELYEGYYHLHNMKGNCEEAVLEYIIRDHDSSIMEARLNTLRHIEKIINHRYSDDCVKLRIREQYRNMADIIRQNYSIVENALEAIRSLGVEPSVLPMRGGTDGARLSFMGLPCPNLGTGSYGHHGPYEHADVQGMDTVVEIALAILKSYAEK